MSLSDIMSQAGLSSWAEAALIVFFVVFLCIVAYVVLRRRGAWERARRLPLDDGRVVENSEEQDR